MANEGLWQQLIELDGRQTAQRANCRYLPSPPRYVIDLLNREYVVNLAEKRVLSAKESSPATFLEELCLLAYLINAQDVPVSGKLSPAEALPGGEFFFRGLHKLPAEELERVFGQHPKGLYRVMDEFNAERCEFGDASIRLHVLPRVPLTVVVWRGDEEFAARASILFDQTAAAHLPLDALWTAANLTVKALLKATGRPR